MINGAEKYPVIYADPPWRFCPDGWKTAQGNNVSRAGVPRHYDTMLLSEIMAMPVEQAAADDCALFLWATPPMLPAAIDVGRAWGFEFKSIAFTWVKRTKHGKEHVGMGHWTRHNPEPCLLFTRGEPKRKDKSVRALVTAQVREHSRKPDEMYELIERLIDATPPFLELFARTTRPGWDQFGDQAGRWLAPRLIGTEARSVMPPIPDGQLVLWP
jgi:N6-adenosine-specific RNA methylase IME4